MQLEMNRVLEFLGCIIGLVSLGKRKALFDVYSMNNISLQTMDYLEMMIWGLWELGMYLLVWEFILRFQR